MSNVTEYKPATHGLDSKNDPDADGAIDPTLENSLIAISEDGARDDDEAPKDLDVGQFIASVRNLGADSGDAESELDTGVWLAEPAATAPDDDLDGPLADTAFLTIEPENTTNVDEPDDEPDSLEDEFVSSNFPAMDMDSEDDSTPESRDDEPIDVNDVAVAWSAQPWCEYELPRAFAPRVSLVSQRNCLVACGDATDALLLEDLSITDTAALACKTRCAAFLDNDASRLAVVTVTGQIRIWNRRTGQLDVENTKRLGEIDRVMDVWREPSADSIWLRLATGNLIQYWTIRGKIGQVHISGRCVAMGGNDQVLLCLLNQSQKLSLMAVNSAGCTKLPLSRDVSGLAQSENTFVATLGHLVVLGSRGYGLWLSGDNGRTFRKVAGCRNVTACVIGQYAGKVHLWAALFFELEDRSELVGIDCRALRIHKLAEYKVVSDSSGPEDDPPERARIDSLLWDSTRQRIVAAGCFGLTCFVAPIGSHIKS